MHRWAAGSGALVAWWVMGGQGLGHVASHWATERDCFWLAVGRRLSGQKGRHSRSEVFACARVARVRVLMQWCRAEQRRPRRHDGRWGAREGMMAGGHA